MSKGMNTAKPASAAPDWTPPGAADLVSPVQAAATWHSVMQSAAKKNPQPGLPTVKEIK